MNNYRLSKTLSVATISVLVLAACEKPEVNERVREAIERAQRVGATVVLNCELTAGLEPANCGFRLRRGVGLKTPDMKVNVSDVQIRLQANGANINVTNGQATLSLESSGSIVGTANFAYSKVGDEILFNQPEQVNDWINSFTTVEIDSFDLRLDNVGISIPDGATGTIAITESVFSIPLGQQRFMVSRSGGVVFSSEIP
jgi:hypothetical protein